MTTLKYIEDKIQAMGSDEIQRLGASLTAGYFEHPVEDVRMDLLDIATSLAQALGLVPRPEGKESLVPVGSGDGQTFVVEPRAELPDHKRATPAEIQMARSKYAHGSDDDIEVDDNALVSRADDGVWVQAWVWLGY